MVTTRSILVAAVAGTLLAGCEKPVRSEGAVHGRVYDTQGNPLSGVRLSLDDQFGLSTLSNFRGEFRLSGASAGTHALFAFHAASQMTDAVSVDVEENGDADAGAMTVSNSCTDEDESGEGGDEGETEGEDQGEPDADAPCDWPPPPMPEAITFDLLVADHAEAAIDPWGIYGGFVDDGLGNLQVGIDFYAPGDFTAGGDYAETIVIDEAAGLYPAAHVGLYVQDEYGYYYVVQSGDITLSAYDDGDGDPATMAFSFHGENLVFAYLECTGILYPDVQAAVTAAEASGSASVNLPPPPPTSDITIDELVPTYVEIGVFPGDGVDYSDTLYVWAVDETQGTSLSLGIPVDALTNTPVDLTWEQAWGSVSVWVDNAGWFQTWDFYMNTATITASDAVTPGAPLTLTLENGDFSFAPVLEPAAPIDVHLLLTVASLSVDEVLLYDWSGDSGCGCTPPPEP